MNHFTLISDYKDTAIYRQSFNQLARDTFGIDFERWYRDGHWNDRYICYSYVDGDRVVANVSVNKMDLILEGQKTKALQIGTVMTHPAYQRRGLSKKLMQVILDTYTSEYTLIYLFAHPGAVDFYPRFEFKTLPETQFTLKVNIGKATPGKVRKLEPSQSADRRIIERLIAERRPVSSIFGVEHAEHILSFYAYNVLQDAWYYFVEGDMILKQENTILHLYDMIGKNNVDFDLLARNIAQDETRNILFYFTPDLLNIRPDASGKHNADSFFIKPATMHIGSQFTYPVTAPA